MKLRLFISTLFINLFSPYTLAGNTIYFSGAIVEDSCSSVSTNSECKNLSKTIQAIQANKTLTPALAAKSKDVASISIMKTPTASHKVLVVNYL